MVNYEKYFDAVETVCGECYGKENDCEHCPVRRVADEYWEEYNK